MATPGSHGHVLLPRERKMHQVVMIRPFSSFEKEEKVNMATLEELVVMTIHFSPLVREGGGPGRLVPLPGLSPMVSSSFFPPKQEGCSNKGRSLSMYPFCSSSGEEGGVTMASSKWRGASSLIWGRRGDEIMVTSLPPSIWDKGEGLLLIAWRSGEGGASIVKPFASTSYGEVVPLSGPSLMISFPLPPVRKGAQAREGGGP